jgi:hypothetical protein
LDGRPVELPLRLHRVVRMGRRVSAVSMVPTQVDRPVLNVVQEGQTVLSELTEGQQERPQCVVPPLALPHSCHCRGPCHCQGQLASHSVSAMASAGTF